MMAFCDIHTARPAMIGTALVLVLLMESVRSYEFAAFDDYFDTLDDTSQFDKSNDTAFPGRELDVSKVKRKLNQYDRKILLTEHNAHRRTTQPFASNMVALVWDLHLQMEARTVVESCNETYELSKDGQSYITQWFSSVGINTWVENAMYKFVVGNILHKWTEQKSYYSFSRNTCRLGKNCDQYIQVIWATASHVGCELNFCDTFHTTARMDRHQVYYVACVYGEGLTRRDDKGNYLKPFTEGVHCQNCPTGFSGCVDGLCQTDPLCETVVDCAEVQIIETCLCVPSAYDRSHRLAAFHWGLLGAGAILSSFLVA